MGGVALRDGCLVIERAPNQLDELAIEFSRILDQFGIEHAFVAGYVAILAGRTRATQDIDVLIEEISQNTARSLIERLDEANFWGPAMPLGELFDMLRAGDPIWIARAEQITPHLEVKFPSDKFDRASLSESFPAQIGGAQIPIGPLELQISYKLYLGTQTDFEDAIHLYTLFAESLRTDTLEEWVEELGVKADYDRLKRA